MSEKKQSVKPSETELDEKKHEKKDDKKDEKLDEERSYVAVNTLLNQALSYMIDNGMVEMDDELRSKNVMNRDKVVRKVDEEGLDEEIFKKIGDLSKGMRDSKK